MKDRWWRSTRVAFLGSGISASGLQVRLKDGASLVVEMVKEISGFVAECLSSG